MTDKTTDKYELYKMQTQEVLKSTPPKPIVGPFDQVFREPQTTHLGPSTVENKSLPRWATPSLESMEDVFLNENFDMRDDYDNALDVQHALEAEMQTPVVETMITNSEIPDADLQPNTPKAPVSKILGNKDNLIKYGAIAIAAYFILIKGK
jgi:hypothetical protein